MALSVKVGNFTQPTSTNATFHVTGLTFQPLVVLFFLTDATANGTTANIVEHIGAMTASQQAAYTTIGNGSAENRGNSNTQAILLANTSGTTVVLATYVSMDASGFTLNFSTVDANPRVINYLALGGSDLTNAYIDTFLPVSGNNVRTGPGFQSSALILYGITASTITPSQTNSGTDMAWGFCDASLNQVGTHFSGDFATSTAGASIQTANIYEKVSSGNPNATHTGQGSITAISSTGYTLNIATATSLKYCSVICLKGGQYAVSKYNQNTTTQGTGNQIITGLTFQPAGLLMFAEDTASSASLQVPPNQQSVGATDGTNQGSIWIGGDQHTANGFDHNTDTTKLLQSITAGVSPTVNSAMTIISLNGNGFTVNNTTVDATSREIAYMAFGSNPVVGGVKLYRTLMGVGTL